MSGLMGSVFGGGKDEAATPEKKTRSYTAEALRAAARELVKGKKCPHGRRVVFVSSHIEVGNGTVLIVEAACPHPEDRRTVSFEQGL